ncbi:MAG: Os1348 family NHLP clan protein [Rhodoferax sp.]
MNQEALGRLMDRWNADATFRAAVRSDPLAAMADMGLPLSDEDKAAIKTIDWSLSDQELAARTSHAM